MEGDEQRRREYEQPNYPRGYPANYAAQNTNVPNPQQLRGGVPGDGSERFRQTQLLATRPPASAPLNVGAGGPQDMGSYGYGAGQVYASPQMHGNQFSYPPDYLQEPQRQRYPPQYQSPTMYSNPQQPQPQLSYESIGSYQPPASRHTAAVDVLSNQFGVPQQYYNTAETTTAPGPPAISQGYAAAAYPQVQYSPANTVGPTNTLLTPALAPAYPPLAPDFIQAAEAEELERQEHDMNSYRDQLANYQRAICETNDNTSRGKLVEAGSSLRELSNWLLRKAPDLGLTRDTKNQPALYRQRLQLWDNFNICWLAFLQRQKDDTQQRNSSEQPPVAGQSILPLEDLEKMAEDLVEQCDELEKAGLVDYQMGVAEQEIISLLYECVDLLKASGSDDEEDTAENPGAPTG